jgi:hypothetical protein
MRFLTISGPGVATDEFCPNCHVLLEEREGNKACQLCHYDTCRQTGQQRLRIRRR